MVQFKDLDNPQNKVKNLKQQLFISECTSFLKTKHYLIFYNLIHIRLNQENALSTGNRFIELNSAPLIQQMQNFVKIPGELPRFKFEMYVVLIDLPLILSL